MQRLFDILFALMALMVLGSLFILVVLLLMFTGEGEVFFKQERIGLRGRKFMILKFATMLKDSPNLSTGTVTVKDDPRVLPVGRFLRKTKVNELPQLINVLLGDMSLIGPRPQTMRCFEAFKTEHQSRIISVRPGLSGLGSVVFRNENEILNETQGSIALYDKYIAPYKGELECWYVENRNIKTYFSLIYATVWVIFFPNSNIVFKLFKDVPSASPELKKLLQLQ